jgi:hypothetical protein
VAISPRPVARWVALGVTVLVALAVSATWSLRRVAGATGDDSKGLLLAFDARSGAERWRATTPGTFGVEDVSTGTVVGRGFPCTSGPFDTVAFDARDGSRRWKRSAGPDGPSSHGAETIATGSRRTGVVIAATAKKLDGVDVKSGDTRWSMPIRWSPSTGANATTVVTDSVRGSGSNARAVAQGIDRGTGKKLWSVTSRDSQFNPSTSIDAESAVVRFTPDNGITFHTQVLDPRSGKVRWESDGVGSPVGAVVAVINPGGRYQGLTSVRDAHSGQELWSINEDQSQLFSVGERVGIVNAAGLRVVDARNGTEAWSRPGSARPVAADERSVVVSDGRTITVLDAGTGAERFDPLDLPDGYEALNAIAVAGNTIYAGVGCAPNAG